ncbi:MAG: Hsp20/alpha crystallin family protein [Saprospiraceae bacterium]|nr:Hsp20/alpha crystallin family protein [Saprospiraceae bacterium]
MKSYHYQGGSKEGPIWKKAIEDFVENINDFVSEWDWQRPAANVFETPTAFEVELAVPGLKKSDFSIQLKGDHLEISVDKNDDEEHDRTWVHKGFQYRNFHRSIRISERVDRGAVKARYKQGILTVLLPKLEEQKDKPGFEVPVQ